MTVFDEVGNAVMENKVRSVRDRRTREVTQKQISEPVKVNTRFKTGEMTADGPLYALVEITKGQQQFLMERGL